MKKRRVSLRISGNVQGVGFRQKIKKIIDENFTGVFGRVKNLPPPDSCVEVVIEGEWVKIHNFILWLEKLPGVTGISQDTDNCRDEFKSFEVE